MWFTSIVAGGLCGAAGVLSRCLWPRPFGLLGVAAFVCLVTFTVWPWLVLPVGILLSGPLTSNALAGRDVKTAVALQAGIVVAGCMAMLFRRLAGCTTKAAGHRPICR